MARVLVVDDDPWTQRMLSAVLARRGHVVDVASDGWEGLLSAGRDRPDLVIVDMRLPTTDGPTFIATLRSRADTARVPALFLTAFDGGRRARQIDERIDALIEKPFRLDVLEEKAAALLARSGVLGVIDGDLPRPVAASRTGRPRHTPPYGFMRLAPALDTPALGLPLSRDDRPTPTQVNVVPATFLDSIDVDLGTSHLGEDDEPPAEVVLSGQLAAFGLSSVLIVLELERKTGMVVLASAQGLGRLWLSEGRVVRALVENAKSQRGALAVYEMLGFRDGTFELVATPVEGEDEIGASTSFLLMEGARLQDERAQGSSGNN